MKKVVEFKVLMEVDDEGDFDEDPVRRALYRGIHIAHAEGYLSGPDDETTEFISWHVSHQGTK